MLIDTATPIELDFSESVLHQIASVYQSCVQYGWGRQKAYETMVSIGVDVQYDVMVVVQTIVHIQCADCWAIEEAIEDSNIAFNPDTESTIKRVLSSLLYQEHLTIDTGPTLSEYIMTSIATFKSLIHSNHIDVDCDGEGPWMTKEVYGVLCRLEDVYNFEYVSLQTDLITKAVKLVDDIISRYNVSTFGNMEYSERMTCVAIYQTIFQTSLATQSIFTDGGDRANQILRIMFSATNHHLLTVIMFGTATEMLIANPEVMSTMVSHGEPVH